MKRSTKPLIICLLTAVIFTAWQTVSKRPAYIQLSLENNGMGETAFAEDCGVEVTTDRNRSERSSPRRQEMSGYGQPDSKRYLIYLCDEERACKGWADRQKGMTSAFMLAIVTDRRFGIVLTKPCNLLLFYRPNHVDWIVPESQLAGKSSVSIDDIEPRLITWLRSMDFNQKYPQDVVYLRTKTQFYWGQLEGKPDLL